MIRNLFQAPQSFDLKFLEKEIITVCSDLIAVNESSGQIAVYCESQPDENELLAIQNKINLHNPSNAPFEPLDSIGALTTLLVVLNVIPLEDGANVIQEEPAHLIAEAEAWSIASQ